MKIDLALTPSIKFGNYPLIELNRTQIQQLDSPFLPSHGPFSRLSIDSCLPLFPSPFFHDSSLSFPQRFLLGCILPLHLHCVSRKKAKRVGATLQLELLSGLERARLQGEEGSGQPAGQSDASISASQSAGGLFDPPPICLAH